MSAKGAPGSSDVASMTAPAPDASAADEGARPARGREGARNPRRALARAVRVNVGAETTREDVARDANNADDRRRADIATEGDAFAPP